MAATGRTIPIQIVGSTQFALRPLGYDTGSNAVKVTTRTAAATAASGKRGTTTLPATSVTGSGATDAWVTKVPATVNVQASFHGAGSNNDWFSWRIWGHKEGLRTATDTATTDYFPRVLLDVKGQLGDCVSLGGTNVPSGQRFADVITIVNDYTKGGTAEVVYNPADGIATLVFDAGGNEFIEWEPTCAVPSGESGSGAGSIGGMWAGL